jgi:uridine kinase
MLLETAVLDLDSGKRVHIPVFEYETGFRLPGRDVDPRRYVIVEGLWPFFSHLLLDLFSIRVFVDTPENHRLSRLLLRVGGDRGWTLDSVLEYYLKCSRPMQTEYIDQGKSIADIIVNGNRPFDSGIAWVVQASKDRLS